MSSADTSTGRVRYRTIDLVTIATLAVAFGVIFWGWGELYAPLSGLAVFSFPPSAALLAGPWLIAGVVGGLIVRKPGAAFATEFLAAAVSTVVIGGTDRGLTVFASGFFQGLGARKLVFLAVFYKRFGLLVAMAAGALAAIIEASMSGHSRSRLPGTWVQPPTSASSRCRASSSPASAGGSSPGPWLARVCSTRSEPGATRSPRSDVIRSGPLRRIHLATARTSLAGRQRPRP